MIGTGELILIFCVILILFGGKKLPELARSIGLGIREFKKAFHGLDEESFDKPKAKKEKNDPVIIEVEAEKEDGHK